jgi:hypothetical protein
MKHSDGPRRELAKAEAALTAMRDTDDVNRRAEHWIELLHAIERVWSKSVAHFKKSPKWDAWHGKYLNLRRSDPLLSYLVNARGAEEHSDEQVVEPVLGSVGMKFPSGRGFVKEMVIRGGRVVNYDGDPMNVYVKHASLKKLPVVNRGKTYAPPTEHLGKPLSNDEVDVATAAVAWYATFLTDAEAKFVTST